ncbi:MAG: hypothetical protein IKZ07_04095 [Akkermansia sp.]|nr:hypothetical protein [Akkermansia sp.]
MTSAQQKVLKSMHERGEATRPQLAQATGLSLVSVGKAVAALCTSGELYEIAEVPSGGGRPVKLYRYNADYACHVLVQGQKEGALLNCTITLLDLHGRELRDIHANFAYLEPESFDGLLMKLLRRQKVRSITLILPSENLPVGMSNHLKSLYNCQVNTPTPATILAQGSKGETATICLMPGAYPTCTMYRHGRFSESGPLHLLPAPMDWLSLDYSDRNQVEEMVARLLLTITCTIRPERITLYSPPFSSRLIERIRYNADTKLRNMLPHLTFEQIHNKLFVQKMLDFCVSRV